MDDELAPEGWDQDPYRRHENRWFSMDTATSLLRDGVAESRDEPPDTPYPTLLVPTAEVAVPNETVRAGDELVENPTIAEMTGGTAAMDWGARTRHEPPSKLDW